jgi:hypothetical protein
MTLPKVHGNKSPEMRKALKELFPKEEEQIALGNCPFCQNPIQEGDFRDALSRKEFGISGLCQECQDKTFG